jgi:uncharacterized membrane protein YfcA
MAMAVVGLTLGLVGAGGSILTVPIMVYLFQIPSSQATGYSLGVVGVTALVALRSYWRQGKVNTAVALKFVPSSIIGVLIARRLLIPSIPDVVAHTDFFVLTKDGLIMSVFAIVMIAAARSMIRPNSPKSSPTPTRFRTIFDISAALMTGIVTGFVGAGGGFLIIPALVSLMNLPMGAAVGTSLMIITINSLSGFASVVASGGADTPFIMISMMAAIASAAALISSKWSEKVSQARLKTGFGWFVLVMGISILIQQTI